MSRPRQIWFRMAAHGPLRGYSRDAGLHDRRFLPAARQSKSICSSSPVSSQLSRSERTGRLGKSTPKEPGLSLFIRLSHAFAAWDSTVKLLAGFSDMP